MKKGKAFIIFAPAFPANETETIWVPSLQTLVTALNRNYPELKIFVFSFQYPATIKTYQWHNNIIIPFNGMYKKRWSRLLMWSKIFFNTKKLKKRFDITGIFSMWCGECTLVAKHTARILHFKYFCWILGQDARANNVYVKRIQPEAQSLVAMSDFLADEFYRNHAIKPAHVIPNGIDTSLFENTLPEKDIDIIGVGSLSTLKQYNILVDIVASLKTRMQNIQVMLCGDGEEAQNIKNQIKKSGLQSNIILMGNLDHGESLQMMQRAKILLHPSSYEGFSTACIEALYAGAQVISFVKPMHQQIKNWHIVATKEEMLSKTFELLQHQTNYDRVLYNTMNESVKEMLNVFGYR